ncbi:hypothetical protein CRG98_030415 [Punica granatum]|uniref:Uncharacterized protein n=1 Tax=Punica granatum TaxID=22663 RepID=A0A2I0IYW3_PUNGR|nr:hypothetical protein CRG98_030415 [Punica granatum]
MPIIAKEPATTLSLPRDKEVGNLPEVPDQPQYPLAVGEPKNSLASRKSYCGSASSGKRRARLACRAGCVIGMNGLGLRHALPWRDED